MDRNEARAQMVDIFSEVMEVEAPRLSDETTANDIEEWDSLSHIRLIVAVERGFRVKFANAEIDAMKCVGDLVSAIVQKAA